MQYGTVPEPGPSQYPAQFSYASEPRHDLIGNRMAAHVGSGIGMLPGMIGAGAGMASTASMVGGVMGWRTPSFVRGLSMLDPTTAALEAGSATMARYGVAAGLGVGAAAGGVVVAGMAAIKYASDQSVRGFQQASLISQHTSNFGFMSGSGRLGRGFSTTDSLAFGDTLRGIDRNDPFTSFGDVTKATRQLTDTGFAQGLSDANAVSRMLKTQIQTMKDMSRSLGTTLEEALPTLRAMRMSGMYSATEQMSMARKMRTAGAYGVGNEAFLSMQQAGAQYTRDMQMGGNVGARLAAGSLSGIGADVLAGRISGNGLMDMTGAETMEQAQTAAASRVSNRVASTVMGTSVGRALLLSLGSKSGDKFNGEIDSTALSSMLSDSTGFKDLTSAAIGKVGGNQKSKASFYTHSEDIAGALLSANNGQDATALIGKLAMQSADGDEDLAKVYLEQLGIRDRRESDLILAAYKNYTARRRETARKMRQSQYADDVRERYRVGITKGIFGSLSETAAAPFQSLGAAMYGQTEHAFEGISDSYYGVSRFNLDDQTRTSLDQRMSGKGLGGASMINDDSEVSWAQGKYLHPGVFHAFDKTMAIGGAVLPGNPITPLASASGKLGRALMLQPLSQNAVQLRRALRADGGRISDDTLLAHGADAAQLAKWSAYGEASRSGPRPGLSAYSVFDELEKGTRTSWSTDLSEIGAGIGSGDINRAMRSYGDAWTKPLAFATMGMNRAIYGEANAIGKVQGILGDGAGKALANRTIGMGGTIHTGGYVSQEKAKENLHKVAKLAGIDKTSANAMELGGGATAVYAAMARSGKDPATHRAFIKNAIQKARGSNGFTTTENPEEYIHTELANALSEEYGRTVTPEEAKIVYQQSEKGVLGGGDNLFGMLLKASDTAMNTSYIQDSLTSARRNTRYMSDTGSLSKVAGGKLTAFKSSLSTGEGISQAFASGGTADSLLNSLAENSSGLSGILSDRSATEVERSIALAAQNRLGGRDESVEKLFKRYGVDEDQQKLFAGTIAGGGASALNDQLSRMQAQEAAAGGTTGGAQMMDSSTTMAEQIEKNTKLIDQVNQSVNATHNQLVKRSNWVQNMWYGTELVVNDSVGGN